jgi:hypothetical protein
MSDFSTADYSRTQQLPLAAIAAANYVALLMRRGLLIFPLVFSGCVSVPVSTEDQQVDFSVQGKLLVFREQDKAALRFFWRQTEDAYKIDVWGSLGQGRIQLRGDAREMLVLRGREVIAAGEPRQVMQSQLGWDLPVAAIPYWLVRHGQFGRRTGAVCTIGLVCAGASWFRQCSDGGAGVEDARATEFAPR